MAKPKRQKDEDNTPPAKFDNWVRSGGAVGDTDMGDQAEYNRNGAGVDSTVRPVGSDPNADVGGKRQPGSE